MNLTREKLREYVNNGPLISALQEKARVSELHVKLQEAITLMHVIHASDTTIAEISAKAEEYAAIVGAYGNLIEDTWHVTWHYEKTILKYAEWSDDGINSLSDTIKLA